MRFLAVSLAATALAGCTVGPDYHRPTIALAPAYRAAAPIVPASERWWSRFGDPLLDRLVDEALARNLDIAAAAARVDQARAAARGADAALLPQIGLDASATRNRQSLDTPIGTVATRLGLPRDYALHAVGGEASWEIDLFGGLRRDREAARADAASTLADAQAVRLRIAAETVDSYLALRGLQARLDVAGRQLDTEHRLAALVRQQAQQGLVADRALNRVIGEEQGLAAAMAPLRAAIAGQINRLAILTGRQAGGDPAGLAAPRPIPAAPDPAGSANPADLLRRRPDLIAAERRLAAANARIGIAVAEYYPHVSLAGLLGVASLGTASLFTAGAVQAQGGGSLRWRLFDFGRVDAEIAVARGRTAEALADYRGAALRATEDVENALVRLQEGRGEIALRESQVVALARSRDQARQGYAGGALALVDVLDADRALLEAADRLASARADAARASVAAVRALGGGWDRRS